MKTFRLALILSLLFLFSCSAGNPPVTVTPTSETSNPGLPNFHKVSDNLYRSGQPNREGMKIAKEMGIKTVVNLRSFHTDWFYTVFLGLQTEHIWCKAWHPEMEDAQKFLKIVQNKDNWPVLVHCQHGSDRTGTMVAIYRIKVQGWAVDKAIDEMVNGPYGFHEIWQDFLPPFLEQFKM